MFDRLHPASDFHKNTVKDIKKICREVNKQMKYYSEYKEVYAAFEGLDDDENADKWHANAEGNDNRRALKEDKEELQLSTPVSEHTEDSVPDFMKAHRQLCGNPACCCWSLPMCIEICQFTGQCNCRRRTLRGADEAALEETSQRRLERSRDLEKLSTLLQNACAGHNGGGNDNSQGKNRGPLREWIDCSSGRVWDYTP